jgi:hypothetical protein
MLAQLLAGLGAVGAVGVIVVRKNNRAAVPADIKAQLMALLAADIKTQWDTYVKAARDQKSKWLPQVTLVHNAAKAMADTKVPIDVMAVYTGALKSGSVETMKTVQAQMATHKQPVLAAHLRDVISIFGG